jgi:hypothetical protein
MQVSVGIWSLFVGMLIVAWWEVDCGSEGVWQFFGEMYE